MEQAAVSEWQKGGIRYAKLKRIVPEFLAPDPLRVFIVAVRRRGGLFRLFNPLNFLQREYVVAATDTKIVVLWLRRPGVFRASIGGIAYEGSSRQTNVGWRAGKLTVNDISYEPIAFHRQDAEELVRIVGYE